MGCSNEVTSRIGANCGCGSRWVGAYPFIDVGQDGVPRPKSCGSEGGCDGA